jgi:limonene-1,2-epoxide hydrolase
VTTHAERLADLFADLERLDFDAVAARCAPDCVYEDVPYADATVTGPDAIKAKLALGLATLEKLPTTIHELVADGDTVLVERTEVWHHPSGERAALRVAAVFKFRGEQLVLWRDYWDARTLLDQQPAAWLPMIPRLVAAS